MDTVSSRINDDGNGLTTRHPCSEDSDYGDTAKGGSDMVSSVPKVTCNMSFEDSGCGKDDGKPLSEKFVGVLETEKATESQSVFNMVNAVMGASVLGFPFVYRSCGLVLTSLLVLVNLAASELSMRFLVIASHIAGKRTYEDLALTAFGVFGQRLVDMCVVVMNLGSLVAYVNILADVWSSVAGTIIPPGAEPSRNLLMTVITFAGALPVALFVRSPQLLSLVSQATVGFVFVFAAVIGGLALTTLGNLDGIELWRWDGIGLAFPVIAYGFTAQQVMFSIYHSLRAASVHRMNNVIQKSMGITCVAYVIAGACGYILFRQRTSGDLLRNLGGSSMVGLRGVYERALKLGYGLSVMGTIPLIIIPFYTTALPIASWVSGLPVLQLSQAQEQYVTVAVLGCALSIGIMVPNVELIFGLMGATVSMLTAYVIPSAIFLKVTSRNNSYRKSGSLDVDAAAGSPTLRHRRRLAMALLAFGLIAGSLATYATLHAVHDEAEVVQLATQIATQEAQAIKAAKAEERAKTVAEAVDVINEATKQLDSVQKKATAAVGVVKQAAASLDDNAEHVEADLPRESVEDAAKAGNNTVIEAQLATMKEHVNTTLTTLHNVTLTLTTTASKLRNSTKSKAGKASKEQSSAAVKKSSTHSAAAPPSSSTSKPSASSSKPSVEKKSSGSNGSSESSAAAEQGGAVEKDTESRAKEVAKELTQAMADTDTRHSDKELVEQVEDAAAALDAVATVANDTLTAVKQGAAVLEAASQETAEKEKETVAERASEKTKKQQTKTALETFVNVTSEAASQLDDSLDLLKEVKANKTDNLVQIVAMLESEGEEHPEKDPAIALLANGGTLGLDGGAPLDITDEKTRKAPDPDTRVAISTGDECGGSACEGHASTAANVSGVHHDGLDAHLGSHGINVTTASAGEAWAPAAESVVGEGFAVPLDKVSLQASADEQMSDEVLDDSGELVAEVPGGKGFLLEHVAADGWNDTVSVDDDFADAGTLSEGDGRAADGLAAPGDGGASPGTTGGDALKRESPTPAEMQAQARKWLDWVLSPSP